MKNGLAKKKTGIARLQAAFGYSLEGLRAAFREEAAFRQETILYILFLPLLYLLPVPHIFKALLLLANTVVLIVELLNSAIEAIVDLASPDHHRLAKQAKDMGSAAVLISLLLALALWGCALIEVF
ncbi:MAG: diacylglycerol kinase [Desulfocapsaceae bacterium]|nr:diacylglycerol kinase [Desulfocapsaceae bacterium]